VEVHACWKSLYAFWCSTQVTVHWLVVTVIWRNSTVTNLYFLLPTPNTWTENGKFLGRMMRSHSSSVIRLSRRSLVGAESTFIFSGGLFFFGKKFTMHLKPLHPLFYEWCF
jgi:hypothetical protein